MGRQNDSEWKRIKDVFSSEEYSLFGKCGVDELAAKQGEIGNCWLIAAGSVVAQDPDRIKAVFLTDELNSAGIYALKLYMMGIPVTVTVDDYLLFKKDTNVL